MKEAEAATASFAFSRGPGTAANPGKLTGSLSVAKLFGRRRSLERCAEPLVRWAHVGTQPEVICASGHDQPRAGQ
jgi:hypothetical protein